jgi:hypothetical protein
MARPRPEKKHEPKPPAEQRVLPTQLKIGDRIVDEAGEYEVIGRLRDHGRQRCSYGRPARG